MAYIIKICKCGGYAKAYVEEIKKVIKNGEGKFYSSVCCKCSEVHHFSQDDLKLPPRLKNQLELVEVLKKAKREGYNYIFFNGFGEVGITVMKPCFRDEGMFASYYKHLEDEKEELRYLVRDYNAFVGTTFQTRMMADACVLYTIDGYMQDSNNAVHWGPYTCNS